MLLFSVLDDTKIYRWQSFYFFFRDKMFDPE